MSEHRKDDNLAARISELGVPMSQKEMEALALATRRARGDGGSRREFRKLVRERLEAETERQALAEMILQTDERTIAQRTLRAFDFVGTALFAMSGTLVAGETGMHVVGCVLVGCATSMGGGTINNILFGTTAGGVYWIRDPRYLLVAVVSSVVTFYSWPHLELELARREMDDLPSGAAMSRDEFRVAVVSNPAFEERVRRAVGGVGDVDEIFSRLDREGSGQLRRDEVLVIARRFATDSPLVFAVESVALGAFAVSGAQSAVVRGLHPLACAAAGVIIVSGGVIRDILCRRETAALSVESYALATGCGAGVYVFLRWGLVTYGWPLPLGFRILCAASTTVLLRAIHWCKKPDSFLAPMANYRDIVRRGGASS